MAGRSGTVHRPPGRAVVSPPAAAPAQEEALNERSGQTCSNALTGTWVRKAAAAVVSGPGAAVRGAACRIWLADGVLRTGDRAHGESACSDRCGIASFGRNPR